MDVHGSRPTERAWPGVQAMGCLCQDAQQNQRNRVADQQWQANALLLPKDTAQSTTTTHSTDNRQVSVIGYFHFINNFRMLSEQDHVQ